MMKFDLVRWQAYAGADPTLPDPRDTDAAALVALRSHIRGATENYLARIGEVMQHPDLNEQGRKRRAAEVAAEAVKEITFAAEATNSRRVHAERLEATPPPKLDDVPPSIAAILHQRLSALDSLERVSFALDMLARGDAAPATWLQGLPASLALVSGEQAETLRNALRSHINPKGASAAANMSVAVTALDNAAAGALRMIREAAGMGPAEAGPIVHA